jgi:hypothetical protein
MAKNHADDPLLVAVNYFEVADRFPDTDAGHKAFSLSLKALQKITAVKPTTAQLEIVYDEGWQVFLDGKPMQLTTPCTAVVPFGPHTITLAKEGFWDTPQRLDVRESRKLEFRKAAPGNSALLQKPIVAGGKAKDIINSMEGTWLEFHGKAKTETWIITKTKDGAYELEETVWPSHSIESITTKDRILFHWANGNDCIVVTPKDANTCTIELFYGWCNNHDLEKNMVLPKTPSRPTIKAIREVK